MSWQETFSVLLYKCPKKKPNWGENMNKKLLNSVMAKYGDTQSNLANLLEISLSCVNAKINEHNAQFTQKEIAAIKCYYHLSAAEVDSIFF